MNTIILRAALPKVVGLEVVGGLSEAVAICKIMNGIDDVESIDAGGVQIDGCGWRLRCVVNVVEVEFGRAGRGYVAG